jgi:hypothetical protein
MRCNRERATPWLVEAVPAATMDAAGCAAVTLLTPELELAGSAGEPGRDDDRRFWAGAGVGARVVRDAHTAAASGGAGGTRGRGRTATVATAGAPVPIAAGSAVDASRCAGDGHRAPVPPRKPPAPPTPVLVPPPQGVTTRARTSIATDWTRGDARVAFATATTTTSDEQGRTTRAHCRRAAAAVLARSAAPRREPAGSAHTHTPSERASIAAQPEGASLSSIAAPAWPFPTWNTRRTASTTCVARNCHPYLSWMAASAAATVAASSFTAPVPA